MQRVATDVKLTLPARPENVSVIRHVLGAFAEALRLVYEEADRYGVFDEEELRAVYGPVYQAEDVGETGLRWDATRAELETALAAGDVEQVEARLTSMSEMNRRFSRPE